MNFFDPDGRGNNPTFSSGRGMSQDINDRLNGAAQAAYQQEAARWNAFAGWMNRNAQLDAIDNRIAAEVQAVWQPVIDRANANLWNSVVAAGRFQAYERSIEAQANANYQISRAMGWASGDLTWAQQWRYRRTDTYESTLRSAAEWSLMLAPGGAPARVAGLAARGAGFGVRAELAAFGAAERGVVGAAEGEGAVQIFRAVGQSESSSILNAGTYGSAPSMGGKYFALTQQGAQDFANASFNAGRQMSVTSTTIPQSVFNQGFLFNDVGGAGASIHFQQDFLPTLYNSMTPIKFH